MRVGNTFELGIACGSGRRHLVDDVRAIWGGVPSLEVEIAGRASLWQLEGAEIDGVQVVMRAQAVAVQRRRKADIVVSAHGEIEERVAAYDGIDSADGHNVDAVYTE